MLTRLTPLLADMILAVEEGESKVEAGITSGPLVEWAWLIIVVPLVVPFLIIVE